MRVTVKLFAAARQLAESESLELELADDASVAMLRQQLARQTPALEPLVSHAMIAVNTQYARDDTVLRAADEIALIPPVSGG